LFGTALGLQQDRRLALPLSSRIPSTRPRNHQSASWRRAPARLRSRRLRSSQRRLGRRYSSRYRREEDGRSSWELVNGRARQCALGDHQPSRDDYRKLCGQRRCDSRLRASAVKRIATNPMPPDWAAFLCITVKWLRGNFWLSGDNTQTPSPGLSTWRRKGDTRRNAFLVSNL
jgi:hypothetical protein